MQYQIIVIEDVREISNCSKRPNYVDLIFSHKYKTNYVRHFQVLRRHLGKFVPPICHISSFRNFQLLKRKFK